jgi:DNA-binding FadR family transcriptional regulator
MTAEAGQVVTSEVKLAARWGWSRQKVRDFLKALSKDGMLIKASNRKRTVLTLCNYSDYNTPRMSGTAITAASEPSGTDFW